MAKLSVANEENKLSQNRMPLTLAPDLVDDPHGRAHFEAWQREKENDINYRIDEFDLSNHSWKPFEMDAWHAQSKIFHAKQRIQELRDEIEQQEQIIRAEEKSIRKFRQHKKLVASNNLASRPPRSSEREDVVKEFTSKWVVSLMLALDVKNCAELEKAIPGSIDRTWRRWLNGKSVPTFNHVSEWLKLEINNGRSKGKKLKEVVTEPKHAQLLTLIRLI